MYIATLRTDYHDYHHDPYSGPSSNHTLLSGHDSKAEALEAAAEIDAVQGRHEPSTAYTCAFSQGGRALRVIGKFREEHDEGEIDECVGSDVGSVIIRDPMRLASRDYDTLVCVPVEGGRWLRSHR